MLSSASIRSRHSIVSCSHGSRKSRMYRSICSGPDVDAEVRAKSGRRMEDGRFVVRALPPRGEVALQPNGRSTAQDRLGRSISGIRFAASLASLARSRRGVRSPRPGLHPATGGDGTQLCSGDMLLEALAACAGVTLRSVATSLEIPGQRRYGARRKASSTSEARSPSIARRRSASRAISSRLRSRHGCRR